MKADCALWIDSKGRLCVDAPASGIKIASGAGSEINPRFVKMYGLEEVDGQVVMPGKKRLEPKSTPDALIAHADLFVDAQGSLRTTQAE